ncbi:MAG: chromosomal replication initiator protein [Alphaproteobacteria bacterium]|jgi:chromosomal replication initiator protein
MTVNETSWSQVRDWLKNEVGEDSFMSWLAPLELDLVASQGQQVTVVVPTRFMHDWVLRHYSDLIKKGLSQALDCNVTLNLQVKAAIPLTQPAPAPIAVNTEQQQPAPQQHTPQQPAPALQNYTAPQQQNRANKSSPYKGNPLDPRFTFENFVIGKSNEFAYAAAKRIAESTDISYNPFILHGGVGLGKTHLMHAIAWHIHKYQQGRRVMYISAEKFLHNFISALKNKNTHDFKNTFRNVDVLMIDDVQFIAGKEATQEEFFHTFEALVGERKQIILTADKSPHEMQGIEDRLRSRLGWGLATEIHKPNLETRMAIISQKATALGIEVSQPVTMMLASKIDTNVRELEGALNRIAAHSTLVQQEINIENAQELLRDLFRHADREVPITDIQKKVAEYYNIKVSDMSSSRRTRAIARPRQIAMYLAKHLTTKSFPEIGKAFGGRDHTTVMHAAKTVERLQNEDVNIAEDVNLLENILKSI